MGSLVNIHLYILNFSIIYLIECWGVKHTCDRDWSYLTFSKRCVKLIHVPSLFITSFTLCSSRYTNISNSRLSNLNKWNHFDFLSENIKNLRLWTNLIEHTPNYTYVDITYDTNTKVITINNKIDYNRSKLLKYVCESSSIDGIMDLERFQITASSSFTPPHSLGLLEHQAKFIGRDVAFSKGIFHGKGWCSRSDSREEFVEINFQRKDGLLKGIVVQDGMIAECRYWINSFYMEFREFGKWKRITEKIGVTKVISLDGSLSEFWLDNALPADAIRIRPLNMNSSCIDHYKVFCLRIELRGEFYLIDYDTLFTRKVS